MPIQILGVTKADYNERDQLAFSTAEQWMNRIPELFITERSHQQSIGISEVGSDCRKCVARKLAGVPKKPDGSWFPFIGTSVHAALEEGFSRWDNYMLEERLFVFEYKSLQLKGSCDMAALASMPCDCTDTVTCGGKTCNATVVVNDWKVVGERGVREASQGKIKNQYRIQAMLYGFGWKQKGFDVSHVTLTFLPRDKDLSEAQVVMMRYDEKIATDALDELVKLIDAAEIAGWDAVIARQPKASFCFDCKKYEQIEESDVASLI